MKHCQANEQMHVEADRFIQEVVEGPKSFTADQELLSHALMKFRTGLQGTVADQFLTFRYMAQNYISSFTEDLFTAGLNLPTCTLKPELGDGKFYYKNLFPPAGSPANPTQSAKAQYSKYLRLGKSNFQLEIELERATGVPLPDSSMVEYDEIVGRELRIGLFEENTDCFVGNCANLECRWSPEYEDRYYFDPCKIDKEQFVLVKIPNADLRERAHNYQLVFELVNFIRKKKSPSTVAMSAGFAKAPLSGLNKPQSLKLALQGGSPVKNKKLDIDSKDIRSKRRGFIPTISSMFEGKVTPKLELSVKPLDFAAKSYGEFCDEVELLPDLGIYHFPQIKILSYARQAMGRDAFSFYGSVANSINTNLQSEVYIKSFCHYFCVPQLAVLLSHFWNANVLPTFAKSSYEDRIDMLKLLFNELYPTLKTLNFDFKKTHPTSSEYGSPVFHERMKILKAQLEKFWQFLQNRRRTEKIVPIKFLDSFSKTYGALPSDSRQIDTKHSVFSIDELMDDFEVA